ncbi:programmed cell death protein 2 [Phalaenopsis equestris]|uniref:programmed cell death protein 2 n=1 Tax=Phalaenopsis equestris TaxID=78828 RepID=UPI0009E627EC|nr:programmed cell death protein 2 [Phalaenopsis equestris]
MESDLSSLRITSLDEEGLEDEGMEDFGMGEQEDDEDDEDDEAEVELTLGFVEKPKNPCLLLRHLFPSKAGGVPAWLDPSDLPSEKSSTCGFCGEPLQFLLQIYAPISDKESTFHRMLYVFMCPSMSCLLKDQHEQWKRNEENPCRSVKIFRCQLPRLNPFYSSEPPKHNCTDKPITTGAPLCCWCGSWKGDKVCGSCKKARYCSAKHQSMHWRLGHKIECCKLMNSLKSSASRVVNGKSIQATEKYASNSLWPEFEIIIEEECTVDTEISEDSRSLSSLALTSSRMDETYQLLSDKFEADTDKKVWASFQERIAKAPEQVLRYCRDLVAKPLWPLSIGRPSKADIPRCSYCKGPLSFEFQIMPQLLFYFGVNNYPDSLDWGTIAAYTCLASCDASISYMEEFAWVQLYPTATVV